MKPAKYSILANAEDEHYYVYGYNNPSNMSRDWGKGYLNFTSGGVSAQSLAVYLLTYSSTGTLSQTTTISSGLGKTVNYLFSCPASTSSNRYPRALRFRATINGTSSDFEIRLGPAASTNFTLHFRTSSTGSRLELFRDITLVTGSTPYSLENDILPPIITNGEFFSGTLYYGNGSQVLEYRTDDPYDIGEEGPMIIYANDQGNPICRIYDLGEMYLSQTYSNHQAVRAADVLVTRYHDKSAF